MNEAAPESVAAVVVTYNRSRLLLECLAALLRQSRPVDKIILIDRKRIGTTLVLKYEVRQPLVYNISVVVAFDKNFDYT